MAPKKSNPMEEPPAAASSEEEEEETSSEEVTSSDDDGEEEDTREPTKLPSPPPQQTQKQTAIKKPEIPPATPNSKSSSTEETGSESESETETEATPKPIATKPMEETSKAATPRSKPASKRGNETEEGQKDSKRANKKGADPDEEDQKKPVEDTKKQLFQRLWSEDDEIAVLKGMIEYSTKKEVDPNQDMNAFHDYIKKSLHVDVSKAQLVDKIRRLKKKYENNLEKGSKKGKDRIFSKQHEQKAYDLSKKLWGSESTSGVIESAAKSNGKARKNQNQKAIQNQFLIYIMALAGLLAASSTHGAEPSRDSESFVRSSFPAGFIFGAGSNAFSAEGAADVDGKTPSIWDTFTKNYPERIWDHSTPNDGVDFYHRYKEDIKLMKLIGLDSFRFSLSWPRLLPNGKISGGVNPLGVKFYNDLIDELVDNDIKPFVTLFHWDLPQVLEDQYDGFLSSEIVNDFRDYVDFCFKTFGDRVKHWVTMPEPNSIAIGGYVIGNYAPSRCSKALGNCTAGNSATEPYIVAHNLLLSHATAVKLYKEEYQAKQKGQIGITIVTQWFMPKTESAADQEAANRMLDFLFGWFAHPITYGDYPEIMRTSVGDRLPKFTEAESKMLKGSYDFLGINYYSPQYAEAPLNSNNNDIPQSYLADSRVTLSTHKDGIPIGTPTTLHWIFTNPKGLKDFMLYIKDKYNNPPIYITENGVADANNPSLSIDEVRKDDFRIKTYHDHLLSLLEAIKEGANVKAYYAWSFFDNYEWDAGLTVCFGMVYVDYKNNLERHLKDSAYWFKNFLESKQQPVAFDEL